MSKAKVSENTNNLSVRKENRKREAVERIERDHRLFVGQYGLPETEPMLIDGLIREKGVSVFYGAFDEFKTTLVLDMMVHVAMGAPWQGRKVQSRPVIWYALEGEDELPKRVQALEAKIGTEAVWGEGHAPIIVRERLPETGEELRRQIAKFNLQIDDHICAREKLDLFEGSGYYPNPIDTDIDNNVIGFPVIVVDTLSLALGGEDEKGPKAAGFIKDCLELLKERPDLDNNPYLGDPEDNEGIKCEQWLHENGVLWNAVAAHVVIIHHQTKNGKSFAGHRAIGGNTSGLYRVHRFGKLGDVNRPYSGILTPERMKGTPLAAPMRFDVQVVPVDGTKQTAAILKDKAKAIPIKLKPVIDALRELGDQEEISIGKLNTCLDEVAANRTSRKRYRKNLEGAGVLGPVEDENGKVKFYRFHDIDSV